MADSLSFGKFVIPTGYESEQAKIALKRKIAEALLQRGLQQSQGMRSPLEVIGNIANAWAGKGLESKASDAESELGKRIRSDYQQHHAQFIADRDSGKYTMQQLADKYADDPMLSDNVKDITDVVQAGKKSGAEFAQTAEGGYRPKAEITPLNNVDWNKGVVPTFDQSGNVSGHAINQLRVGAALAAQGLPGANGQPIVDPATYIPSQAAGGASPSPSAAPAVGADALLQQLPPEDRQAAIDAIKLRAQQHAAQRNIPQGNPLKRPPDGVAGGKPYWMVNGVPYDNPEGR